MSEPITAGELNKVIGDLKDLKSEVEKIAEYAFGADGRAKRCIEENKKLEDRLDGELSEAKSSLNKLTLEAEKISEHRGLINDLSSNMSKHSLELKSLAARLSPENGLSYEALLGKTVEALALLEGDSADASTPSYRAVRATVSEVKRTYDGEKFSRIVNSVDGDNTTPSLDVFRSDYLATQNKKEGVSSIFSRFTNLLGPLAASGLVWVAYGQFDTLSTAQIEIQGEIERLGWEIGSDATDIDGLNADIEKLQDRLNALSNEVTRLEATQ